MFLKKFPLVSAILMLLPVPSFLISFGTSAEELEMSKDMFTEVSGDVTAEDTVEDSTERRTTSGERIGRAAL
jgi:hypothetical protein